ncbi:MAG: response regulator [Anaerolineaceae bacterium]|nr:MAG: response regulator [Anaerolineaceae bacterium]
MGYVLLVEDDELDVLAFRRALRSMPTQYALKVASTGEEALALLELAKLPSFILTDLNMPVMDGMELLTALTAHPVWHEIPVVVFTTSAQPDERAACLRLRAADVLVKPLAYTDFVELIHDIMRRYA